MILIVLIFSGTFVFVNSISLKSPEINESHHEIESADDPWLLSNSSHLEVSFNSNIGLQQATGQLEAGLDPETPILLRNITFISNNLNAALTMDNISLFVEFNNCTFQCTSPGEGKGFDGLACQHLYFENCTFIDGQYGIILANTNQFSIANCTFLEQSNDGINLQECANFTLSDVQFTNCVAQGINIIYSSDGNVSAVDITNSFGNGVRIYESSQIICHDIKMFTASTGFRIEQGSTDIIIENVIVQNVSNYGFFLEESHWIFLNNISIKGFYGGVSLQTYACDHTYYQNINASQFCDGILFYSSSQTILTQSLIIDCNERFIGYSQCNECLIFDCDVKGQVKVEEMVDSLIINNTLQNSLIGGIELLNSQFNVLWGNNFSNAHHDGIYVDHSPNNLFGENVIRECQWNGIALIDSLNTTLINNNITQYAENEIYCSNDNVFQSVEIYGSIDELQMDYSNSSSILSEYELEGLEFYADLMAYLHARTLNPPLPLLHDNGVFHSLKIFSNSDFRELTEEFVLGDSADTPIVLQNITFIADTGTALYLYEISLYIEFRDCIFTGQNDADFTGFNAINCNNFYMENCTFLDGNRGISIKGSEDFEIVRSSIRDQSETGIVIDECEDFNLDSVHVARCGEQGLSISDSHKGSIFDFSAQEIGSDAIYIFAGWNLGFENLNLWNCRNGMYIIDHTDDLVVRNVYVEDIQEYGIYLDYAEHTTLENVTINGDGEGTGILAVNCVSVFISTVEVSNLFDGVIFLGNSHSVLHEVDVSTCVERYITFADCDECLLVSCAASGEAIIENDIGCLILNNDFSESLLSGFEVYNSHCNIFWGNSIDEPEHSGMYLHTSNFNLIGQNHIENCNWNGIDLIDAYNNTLLDNEISHCHDQEIFYSSSNIEASTVHIAALSELPYDPSGSFTYLSDFGFESYEFYMDIIVYLLNLRGTEENEDDDSSDPSDDTENPFDGIEDYLPGYSGFGVCLLLGAVFGVILTKKRLNR